MKKLSLLTLVNQYIDDEKKRNKTMRSMSAIYQWIEGDVDDELTAINDEYNLIVEKNDKQARIIFEDSIKAHFKTNYFQDFLLNKSKTTEPHYKKLKNKCSISNDAIKGFFKPESGSNPKTLDFFTAFCKNQQREYGEKLQTPEKIALPPPNPDERQTKTQQIVGATIIDEAFIQKVKTGKTFTMPEFYTAKQNEDCQWYGIIEGYDVERNIYPQLKDIAKTCFNNYRTLKVSAIVFGAGGVGKSTILRKMAVELTKESYIVLWLKDTHIREFIESDFRSIEKNQQHNYLIIVEDWYRIFQNDYGLERQFLIKTDALKNIRVIIGDRHLDGKKFMDHLNDSTKTFQLDTQENKKIIAKVIAKISGQFPQWGKNYNELFIHESNYQSSLFLLLFVLARITENENHSDLDLSEPETAFINIIKADLEYIYAYPHYQGLAISLYYWSCIYSKHRVFITYETFLKIVDYYQKTKDLSQYLDWETENPAMSRLKLYINIDNTITDEYNSRDKKYSISPNFIQFNHDILSDKGISMLQSQKIGFFSVVEKKQILDTITDFGDDVSASYFLNIMLREEQGILKNTNLQKQYINKLIDKENTHNAYLSYLIDAKAYKSDLEECLRLFLYNHDLEDELEERFEDLIFEDKDWKTIDGFYISQAMLKAYSYSEKLQKFTEKVLIDPDWRTIEDLVLADCIEKCKNEELKEEICNKILSLDENEIFNYEHQINTALRQSFDKTRKQKWFTTVLTHNSWKKISSSLICQCLWECTDSSLIENFCEKVLTSEIYNDNNLHTIFNDVLLMPFNTVEIHSSNSSRFVFGNNIVVSPNTLYFDMLKQKFIDRLFENKESVEKCQNIETYFQDLIITALGISDNHKLRYNYSEEILNHQNYSTIKPSIICQALEISTNLKSIWLVINKILNEEYIDEYVFFKCLKVSHSKELALFYVKKQDYYDIKLPRINEIEYKNLLLSISILQESLNRMPNEVVQLRKIILNYPYSSKDKKEKYHNQLDKKVYDLLLTWNEISFDIYKKMVIDVSFERGTNNLFDLYDNIELNFFEDN